MQQWAARYTFSMRVCLRTAPLEPLSCRRVQPFYPGSFRWIFSSLRCPGISAALKFLLWQVPPLVDYLLGSFKARPLSTRSTLSDRSRLSCCLQVSRISILLPNASRSRSILFRQDSDLSGSRKSFFQPWRSICSAYSLEGLLR